MSQYRIHVGDQNLGSDKRQCSFNEGLLRTMFGNSCYVANDALLSSSGSVLQRRRNHTVSGNCCHVAAQCNHAVKPQLPLTILSLFKALLSPTLHILSRWFTCRHTWHHQPVSSRLDRGLSSLMGRFSHVYRHHLLYHHTSSSACMDPYRYLVFVLYGWHSLAMALYWYACLFSLVRGLDSPLQLTPAHTVLVRPQSAQGSWSMGYGYENSRSTD